MLNSHSSFEANALRYPNFGTQIWWFLGLKYPNLWTAPFERLIILLRFYQWFSHESEKKLAYIQRELINQPHIRKSTCDTPLGNGYIFIDKQYHYGTHLVEQFPQRPLCFRELMLKSLYNVNWLVFQNFFAGLEAYDIKLSKPSQCMCSLKLDCGTHLVTISRTTHQLKSLLLKQKAWNLFLIYLLFAAWSLLIIFLI